AMDSTAADSDGYSPRCFRTKPHRTLPDLGGKLVRLACLLHGSIFSRRIGASSKPGAIQTTVIAGVIERGRSLQPELREIFLGTTSPPGSVVCLSRYLGRFGILFGLRFAPRESKCGET